MDAKCRDSEITTLVGDVETLSEQAERPPDTPFSDVASNALGRVYARFVRRVYSYCSKRVRFSLPVDCSLEEFVETVFFRFVRSADQVKLVGQETLADIESQILACLHGHARWALRDLLQKAAKVDELAEAIMRDVGTPRSDTDLPSSSGVLANRKRLRSELDRMGERACDVLLTSYQHLDLTTRQFRLPDDVRDELCKRCKFKSANTLTQYRLRRIAELRSKLSSVA